MVSWSIEEVKPGMMWERCIIFNQEGGNMRVHISGPYGGGGGKDSLELMQYGSHQFP